MYIVHVASLLVVRAPSNFLGLSISIAGTVHILFNENRNMPKEKFDVGHDKRGCFANL